MRNKIAAAALEYHSKSPSQISNCQRHRNKHQPQRRSNRPLVDLPTILLSADWILILDSKQIVLLVSVPRGIHKRFCIFFARFSASPVSHLTARDHLIPVFNGSQLVYGDKFLLLFFSQQFVENYKMKRIRKMSVMVVP